MPAVVKRISRQPEPGFGLADSGVEVASRRGLFNRPLWAGRWRQQMFERGESGGAFQPAIEFVEVASRELIVAKGDWDRWVGQGKESSMIVHDVHGPIVTGVLGGD